MILNYVIRWALHVKNTSCVVYTGSCITCHQALIQHSLQFITFTLLCKSDDVKLYGYGKVLEPLLQDLCVLEEHGVFISKLGKFVKGTVHSVVADNLGAHSLAGFVESFSGQYVCRFCTAQKVDIQSKDVQSGDFVLRTK